MIQAAIQTKLLCKHGILSRGGTVLGDYFRNEDFVFGPSIVDAYNLEQLADTPRMVVDEKVIKTYMQSAVDAGLVSNEKAMSEMMGNLLMMDSDSETYVHYLNAGSFLMTVLSGEKNVQDGASLLEAHRIGLMKAITDNKKDILKDRKLRRKYAWAIKYHNDVVDMSGFGNRISLSELYE